MSQETHEGDNGISIREAVIDDLETVLQLDKGLYDYDGQLDHTLNHAWSRSPKGIEYFTHRIRDRDGIVLIAERGGEAVGSLVGGVVEALEYRTFSNVCELESMFVVEGCRSSGVGARLVERFLAWVRANYGGNVRVEVTAANAEAIRFYSKMGFSAYNVVLETWVGQPRT
jgi:GNAT superfamily N-acetyltransferase